MSSATPARLDPANGYESRAAEFMARRSAAMIGVATVRFWARSFRRGARLLDLGCGHGVPVTQALVDAGLNVSGIDASSTLMAEFRRRFPGTDAALERVEDSHFFGQTFEGVIAVGLVFLLAAEAQRELFCKVALGLEPGGRFLFTAPTEQGDWPDVLTGRPSVSLGRTQYLAELEEAGFTLVSEYDDEGANHYYDCRHGTLGLR